MNTAGEFRLRLNFYFNWRRSYCFEYHAIIPVLFDRIFICCINRRPFIILLVQNFPCRRDPALAYFGIVEPVNRRFWNFFRFREIDLDPFLFPFTRPPMKIRNRFVNWAFRFQLIDHCLGIFTVRDGQLCAGKNSGTGERPHGRFIIGYPYTHLPLSAVSPRVIRNSGKTLSWFFNTLFIGTETASERAAFDYFHTVKKIRPEFSSQFWIVGQNYVPHISVLIIGPLRRVNNRPALNGNSSPIGLNFFIGSDPSYFHRKLNRYHVSVFPVPLNYRKPIPDFRRDFISIDDDGGFLILQAGKFI